MNWMHWRILIKFYEEDSFDLTYGGLHYVNPNGTITNKMSKNDEKRNCKPAAIGTTQACL